MDFNIDQLLNTAAAYQETQRKLETVESNSIVTIGVPGSDTRKFNLEGELLVRIKNEVAARLKGQLNELIAELKELTTEASPYQ